MRVKGMLIALLLALALAVAAQAAFCPRCHKQIGDDQKYCAECFAQMQAELVLSQSEKELVADVLRKRESYREALDTLRKFYTQRGNAEGKDKTDKELGDFRASRKYRYQNWEDTLPFNLSPAEAIREADLLYRRAESLRADINPFGRERRVREAALVYRTIIDKYPTGLLVDDAAFRLGEVYEELGGPDTLRAARFYVLCFLWNAKTEFPARYRAARVYDVKLKMYDWAAWLYKLAATDTADPELRHAAAIRFAQLQGQGFQGEPPAEILNPPGSENVEEPAAGAAKEAPDPK